MRRRDLREGSSFLCWYWLNSRGCFAADGRGKVIDTLDGMLRTRGVQVESPALARKALDAARSGAAGFADHLIAEISFAAGANEILTFDKAFARQTRVRRLH